MAESIWVTNPSKEAESRLKMTWDLKDQIVLDLPTGDEIVWSIKEDKPVFEESDGRLCIRCNFRRLYPLDTLSTHTLQTWRTRFYEVDEPATTEFVSVDIAKYARLLADGLISLEDFNLLTKQTELPASSEVLNDSDPMYEEYLNAINAAWPGIIKLEIDLLGRISSKGAPKTVDKGFVKTKLESDQREFHRATTSPEGLVNIYISLGSDIQFKGIPKGFVNELLQGLAGSPALSKLFTKEIRRGVYSPETRALILRYRTQFQSRQVHLWNFARKKGWDDLPFL
jgi:hypothetical protein